MQNDYSITDSGREKSFNEHMPKITFIEGISGVGKTTLANSMRKVGTQVFVESDPDNPIDFYCAAYFTKSEYSELCSEFPDSVGILELNSLLVGSAKLVRYYGGAKVFGERLLSELREHELCWQPKRIVEFSVYCKVMCEVFRKFAESIFGENCEYVFDGSLIHHPVNDMLRNYSVTPDAAKEQVLALLNELGGTDCRIIYLKPENAAERLRFARAARGQTPSTPEQIAFLEKRLGYDLEILRNVTCPTEIICR